MTNQAFPSLARVAAAVAVLAAVSGCVGPVSDDVGTNFRAKWIASHKALETPYANVVTAAERNEFIDEYVAIKNIEFHNYVAAIRRGTSLGSLSADGSRLVLDGLAATTGGEAVKAALAAASAGITGFTGSLKKDVMFDQALPTFVEKMESLRANKLADITIKKKRSIAEYTRSEAFTDVEDYGAAGSFDAALRSLNTQTGQDAAQAKAGLATAKGDDITAAAVTANPQSVAVAARGAAVPRAPAAVDQSRIDAMRARRDALRRDRPKILDFVSLLGLIDGFKAASAEEKTQAYAAVVAQTIPTDPASPVQPTPDSLNFHYQGQATSQAERANMRNALLAQVNRLGAKEVPPVVRK